MVETHCKPNEGEINKLYAVFVCVFAINKEQVKFCLKCRTNI